MKTISRLGSLAIAVLLLAFVPAAQAGEGPITTLPGGVQHMTYSVPLDTVTAGQNKIRFRPFAGDEKPSVNGWITKIRPDLVYTSNGRTPPSSRVMFHHGVWINSSTHDQFFATGEEKTQLDLPDGYGYRYRATHNWVLNEMIHNLVTEPMDLTVTYRIEFIPDTADAAENIKPARPIWMDVQDGSLYPVFDTYRDSGGADGEYVYPEDRPNAYPGGAKKNEHTIPQDGVLLGTTGHVHTGGLSTDLYLRRQGATYDGPTCADPVRYDAEYAAATAWLERISTNQSKLKSMLRAKQIRKLQKSMKTKKFKRLKKNMKPRKFTALKRKKTKRLTRLRKINSKKLADLKQVNANEKKALGQQNDAEARTEASQKTHDECQAKYPDVEGNRVHLFESAAHYFEPAGPVSWDMAMKSTRDTWRVQVKAGDVLDLQSTYETERASWFENMGINVVFWSPGETNGRNPYVTKVDTPGEINHGHYAENDDHGGTTPLVGPDPATLPDGLPFSTPIGIGAGYEYKAGNFRIPGAAGRPPVVEQGEQFTFTMNSSDVGNEVWHSLTSCKAPCNKSTGIAYPIPDGDFQFDSGQLGVGGAPTVDRTTWSTPGDLPVGTHTFFCRIHPLMRGAVRVKPKT